MSLTAQLPITHLHDPRKVLECCGLENSHGARHPVRARDTVFDTYRCPPKSICPWANCLGQGTVPSLFPNNGGFMHACIALASSALALVLVLALVREVRLRRALQVLLRRLLAKWRSNTDG